MRKAGFIILVLMIITGSAVFADQAEAKNNLLIIADELEAQYGLKRIPGNFGQVFDIAEGNYIEINRTLYGGTAILYRRSRRPVCPGCNYRPV